MSSNRLSYDSCAYQKSLQQSMGPLDYMMYTGKYENSAKCRIEFGTVGGNGVSIFSGNLVDLESDLRGQTRQASMCPSNMYHPSQKMNGKLLNQPSCQMQYYPKVPIPQQNAGTTCNYNNVESFTNRNQQHKRQQIHVPPNKHMQVKQVPHFQARHGNEHFQAKRVAEVEWNKIEPFQATHTNKYTRAA